MDGLSAASAVITVLVLLSQAFKTLYQTIDSIHDLPTNVISIRDELKALDTVLALVNRAASRNPDALRQLKPLLAHCVKESERFTTLITSCTKPSKAPGKRLLDWARFKLAQKEIEGFRGFLGRAKQNISLAIGAFNLEGITVSAELIEEVRQLISENATEIKAHIKEVNEELRELRKQDVSVSVNNKARWDELQAEKIKCEKELSSLSEVSRQLEQLEVEHLETILSDKNTNKSIQNALKKPVCEPMTISDLQNFLTKLPYLIYELTTRLLVVEKEQEAIFSVNQDSVERLQAEKKVDENCMQTLEEVTKQVSEKSTNVFKNIRGAENADQIFVSTFNQLLHVDNVSTGQSGRLWCGQMSDESLQALGARERPRNAVTLTEVPVPQERRKELSGWLFAALLMNVAFASLLGFCYM